MDQDPWPHVCLTTLPQWAGEGTRTLPFPRQQEQPFLPFLFSVLLNFTPSPSS